MLLLIKQLLVTKKLGIKINEVVAARVGETVLIADAKYRSFTQHSNDFERVVELFEHPVQWLIDLGPRNRGFYTGVIKIPKIHRSLKGMCGLWSSTEALHIQKSQKPPCLIEDPWGRRFWIFPNRIFCSDFLTKFVNIKTLLRDYTGANVFLAKFQSRSKVK